MQLKLGDNVQLKSGGPIMNVKEIRSENIVRCYWFNKNNELVTADFASESLEIFTFPKAD